MPFGPGKEIYVPENAVKAEKILVLQITAAAPFIDLDAQGIFACMNKSGNIELRLKMRALGKADEIAVYIDFRAGGNAF